MPACDENACVFQRRLVLAAVHEVREGGVALHEEAGVQRDAEAVRELGDAVGFGFAAAVGEQEEGDAVGLEVLEGALGAGKPADAYAQLVSYTQPFLKVRPVSV